MNSIQSKGRFLILCVTVCGYLGCATLEFDPTPTELLDEPETVRVEHGKPYPIMDGIGWVLGIPNKLILLDARADNHQVSQQTEAELMQYIDENALSGIVVRINQYDPVGEFRRLKTNTAVGTGWRYTLGLWKAFGYTIFPGRLFGGDSYNPYTNSIYIYSDLPAIALEQAAYAKDVQRRLYPGTYAATQELPFVGLYREFQSKDDVLAYYRVYGGPESQWEASRVLHPQFGAEIGENLDRTLLASGRIPVFRIAGAAVGHVFGHSRSDLRFGTWREPRASEPAVPETPMPQLPGGVPVSTASHQAGENLIR